MAVHLRRYFSQTPPLREVSEHVMAIPGTRGVFFNNRHFKVICILQGSTRLRIDGEEFFHLSAGDVIVLPHACRQHYSSVTPDADHHVHILLLRFTAPDEAMAKADNFTLYLNETFTKVRQLKASSTTPLRPLIIRLRQATEIGSTRSWLAEELALQIVFEIARLLGIYRFPSLLQPWKEAEQEHLALIKAGNAPHDTSKTTWRRWLGVTATRYRSILRVEEAKEMMTYRLQPISVLAQKLGFNSPSAFSRSFRLITGYYPKEFQHHLQLRDGSLAPIHSKKPWLSENIESLTGASQVPGTPGEGWLLVAIAGTGEIFSEGTRMTVNSTGSDIICVAMNKDWGLISRKGSSLKISAISVSQLPGAVALGGKSLTRIRLPRRRELELMRTYLQGDAPEPHKRLYAESLYRALVAELWPASAEIHASLQEESSNTYRLPTDYAKEYIHKHFNQPVKLSEVAWFAGVSEEHLARSFKSQHGITVMEYLKGIRLRNARNLLSESTETVTEVARLCGFSTPAYFCRVFLSTMKMTPMQYREREAVNCKE